MESRQGRPNVGPYTLLLHMPDMAQKLEALRLCLRDEASLSRFTSSSADLVEAVHIRASVPVERVVEGFSVAGERVPEEVATATQRRSAE